MAPQTRAKSGITMPRLAVNPESSTHTDTKAATTKRKTVAPAKSNRANTSEPRDKATTTGRIKKKAPTKKATPSTGLTKKATKVAESSEAGEKPPTATEPVAKKSRGRKAAASTKP